jgi:hypothetical protein
MAITSIGNRLKEYQNSPVLQRNAFRNKGMDRADGRAVSGLLASSPELINAVIQNQIQPSAIPANFMGFDQQPDANTVDLNSGTARGRNNSPRTIGSRTDGYTGDLTESQLYPNSTAKELKEANEEKPFVGKTEKQLVDEANAEAAKKAAAKKGPDKSGTAKKADASVTRHAALLAELKGQPVAKTKKEALEDAKEFLKLAGVDDVSDIRSSKDFMLMTLGLNIAAGQSGDFLTNVAGGAKETLGTFGELKAAEKKAERELNLTAATMAQKDVDAETARQEKRFVAAAEAELSLLTNQIKMNEMPDAIKTAEAINASRVANGLEPKPLEDLVKIANVAKVTDKMNLATMLGSDDPAVILRAIAILNPSVIGDLGLGKYSDKAVIDLFTKGKPMYDAQGNPVSPSPPPVVPGTPGGVTKIE